MKLANTLEESLNGEWKGLYGEVVDNDCYRLKSVPFTPDLVIDIGANVGTFTRFARTLWPDAKIVAIEPDPVNAAHFRKFTPEDANIELHEIALGVDDGPIFHGLTARNGSGETYLSPGLGYPVNKMLKDKSMVQAVVEAISLEAIIGFYWQEGFKTVLKIDCEGAENCIWEDKGSMQALRKMDYLALEVHFYAQTAAEQQKVNRATLKALRSLEKTHHCQLDGVHFWATKKS